MDGWLVGCVGEQDGVCVRLIVCGHLWVDGWLGVWASRRVYGRLIVCWHGWMDYWLAVCVWGVCGWMGWSVGCMGWMDRCMGCCRFLGDWICGHVINVFVYVFV